MSDSIRVNLHCHSDLSDGQLSPEALADRLARSGVRVAALTDHDTVAGLPRFREALTRRGVACIQGLELSTVASEGPIHLLAYGFDPHAPHLEEALRRVREPSGLPVSEGLRLIRLAGGRSFLAHPLETEPDAVRLKARLLALQAEGLDGIEAVYAPYSVAQIQGLLELARELGLAVCAGTDFHGPHQQGLSDLGVNFPLGPWRCFRGLLFASSPPSPSPPSPAPRRPLPRLDWRRFLWRILVPTAAAILLLVVLLFAYVVPAYEEALLSRKREMIRELTASACSILEEYRQESESGRLGLAEAQSAAKARLQFLRYGREGKDYFWVTDLQPRMVMHPYRTDLNGSDVSRFQDPKGNRVFMASAELAKARKEGYLEYVWQWKDDPGRLQAKQSYVRLFEPWGWVVGTGIYLEDVHAEIGLLTGRIVRVTVLLALAISLLLLFLARQSFRSERQRALAEDALAESHERYRALVGASKEGMILLVRGRPVFANPVFLEMAGLREDQWTLMDLEEILVMEGGLQAWMDAALGGATESQPVEARLLRAEEKTLPVLLSVGHIQIGAQAGTLLVIRDLTAIQENLGRGLERARPTPLCLDLGPPWETAAETPPSDSGSLERLAQELRQARSLQAIVTLRARLPWILEALLSRGQRAGQLCRGMSAVADAAVTSLIAQAVHQLGEPPAPYAYLMLGSHGREELTLASDQDSALIFTPPEGADPAAVQGYFLRLAETVGKGLEVAGYPRCQGGMMADNPRWCRSLNDWRQHFTGWIQRTEAQDLLEFGTFFDFRCVQGEAALAEVLREHIRMEVGNAPAFIGHLAHLAVQYRNATGFFGHLVTQEDGCVDLKEAFAPIVHIGRLYALRHGLPETSTAGRFRHMQALGLLSDSGLEDIGQGQEFLLALRLRHQLEQLAFHLPGNNRVEVKRLTRLEDTLLKQVAALVPLLQKKVGFDFPGTT